MCGWVIYLRCEQLSSSSHQNQILFQPYLVKKSHQLFATAFQLILHDLAGHLGLGDCKPPTGAGPTLQFHHSMCIGQSKGAVIWPHADMSSGQVTWLVSLFETHMKRQRDLMVLPSHLCLNYDSTPLLSNPNHPMAVLPQNPIPPRTKPVFEVHPMDIAVLQKDIPPVVSAKEFMNS